MGSTSPSEALPNLYGENIDMLKGSGLAQLRAERPIWTVSFGCSQRDLLSITEAVSTG